MLAQSGTLSHRVSEQPGPQAGSPLATYSTAAPGVSDVLDHMETNANRQVSPQLHGNRNQVTVRLRSAELPPKDFSVPKRDTTSGETRASEESSDALVTKIQELVSARTSRAGSLSQGDYQAARDAVPSLPTQEQYSGSEDKEIDHGTVIRRPNKGKHRAIPTAWNQESGSDTNEPTSVTHNTSSRNLMADCTPKPDSPQKSKPAKKREQRKKKAQQGQPETSTLPVLTTEDNVVESTTQPREHQKRAGRSSLNPMGFDLHGSPQRGSLTHTQDSSSFLEHSLASGSTESRPEHDQQMRESQQYQPGPQPGQQYGSLAVKKQRELQSREYQPSINSSSSQKPSYSAPPRDYGPALGYSTFNLPYPSPPKAFAIAGSGQPREEQRPFAGKDKNSGQSKPSNGCDFVYHRESSIPFPPYVEPPSLSPSADVPFIFRSKPAKKQGDKKKKLNPEAKEFVAANSVSSNPAAMIARPEVREVAAVPTSPTSKGLTSRPATPASPREPNVPDLQSDQPTESLAPVKDDASEASSRTMTAGDDVAKEEDCRPVENPSARGKTKDSILEEEKGPNFTEEPVIKHPVESQPASESSQTKDSEKPTQQPVDKPAADQQGTAPEGGKKREAKQGKQWPKNKQFKKGHKRQEARGDINQAWRKVDQNSNQDPIAQASEASDAKDTASAAPSASGDHGSGRNKDQGKYHLAVVANAEEQNRPSCEERIRPHEEKNSTEVTEKTEEKAAVSVEHDPTPRPEPKVKTQNQAQSATVQPEASEQRDATRSNHSADTRCSAGAEKRAWSVAVPLTVPGKSGQSVESPKTKPRATSKAGAHAVTGAEENPQEGPNHKGTEKDVRKKGNTPKKQKKPTADNEEEPSSIQAQPPRYVPGASWVEEPKDNKKSKKPKASQSMDKDALTQTGEGDGPPGKDKGSAAAPSGLTAQPAPSRPQPQASEKDQIETDKTSDSTVSSTPATNTTNDTLSPKDDGELQTEAQAADSTGSSTPQTQAAESSDPTVPTTRPSKGQKKSMMKKKKRAREAALKKAQTEPAAAPTAEPAPTSNGTAGTAAPEKAGQPQAKPGDAAKPPARSAPAPVTASSSLKGGPSPLAPAPKETSPQKPGRGPKKPKGKDASGSPETLLEGEERK